MHLKHAAPMSLPMVWCQWSTWGQRVWGQEKGSNGWFCSRNLTIGQSWQMAKGLRTLGFPSDQGVTNGQCTRHCPVKHSQLPTDAIQAMPRSKRDGDPMFGAEIICHSVQWGNWGCLKLEWDIKMPNEWYQAIRINVHMVYLYFVHSLPVIFVSMHFTSTFCHDLDEMDNY